MNKPKLGDRIRFLPAAFAGERGEPGQKDNTYPREVTGRVVYINQRHRFFDVEFELNGYRLREAFKYNG